MYVTLKVLKYMDVLTCFILQLGKNLVIKELKRIQLLNQSFVW